MKNCQIITKLIIMEQLQFSVYYNFSYLPSSHPDCSGKASRTFCLRSVQHIRTRQHHPSCGKFYNLVAVSFNIYLVQTLSINIINN